MIPISLRKALPQPFQSPAFQPGNLHLGDQELLIDGIASRSRRDSVDIRLSNFDLAALTPTLFLIY